MEELYKMYDEMLERDNAAPQYIGYCGFPCDGYCYECNGRGRFDMADEIWVLKIITITITTKKIFLCPLKFINMMLQRYDVQSY
jgi:hypothetical protein